MLTVKELMRFVGSHPKTLLPWSRGSFTYSTDGHVMVRVPRHPEVKEIPEAPNAEAVFEMVIPVPSDYIDIPELEGPEFERCSECNGDKVVTWRNNYHSYEADCKTCDGTGHEKKFQKTKIGNIIFQTDLLRKLIKLPNIKISVEGAKPDSPVWFKFDGGDGLIMPCRF